VKRYVTEVVGTFFFVFAIGMTAVNGTEMAPLAIGSMLMVMVYMGGHVSGAHYNPSVSIALMMRGALDSKDLVPYIVSQLVGGTLAAILVMVITGSTFAPAPGAEVGTLAVLAAEIAVTFALSLVIMNVATHPDTDGNSYYGLAIGFTVLVGAFSVGGISGGVFNPAVGTGPILVDALLGDGGFGNLWYYWVGPIVGATLAVPVFKMQLPEGVS
jgi:aquaporin Z